MNKYLVYGFAFFLLGFGITEAGCTAPKSLYIQEADRNWFSSSYRCLDVELLDGCTSRSIKIINQCPGNEYSYTFQDDEWPLDSTDLTLSILNDKLDPISSLIIQKEGISQTHIHNKSAPICIRRESDKKELCYTVKQSIFEQYRWTTKILIIISSILSSMLLPIVVFIIVIFLLYKAFRLIYSIFKK